MPLGVIGIVDVHNFELSDVKHIILNNDSMFVAILNKSLFDTSKLECCVTLVFISYDMSMCLFCKNSIGG